MRETDRLREMLDKRGIKWRAVEGVDGACTTVEVGHTCYTYLETKFGFETTAQFWWCDTAEQAIDATLGDGRREEKRALIADMWSWMERAMYDGEQGKGEYLALYERKVRLETES